MRTSLEKPFRIKSAAWKPAGTGSQKIHTLRTVLEYCGDGRAMVCEFLTSVDQALIQCKFSTDAGDPHASSLTVHGKFQTATIASPKTRDGKGTVRLVLILAKDDVTEMRELLVFLTEAARVETFEVDCSFEIFQQDLPKEVDPPGPQLSRNAG